mgnify:CR=1 FL=1
MGKRLVSLLTALALAVSAFASLAVAPAGAVVENPQPVLYVPFLPNGEDMAGTGPWYGTITVQNLSGQTVTAQLKDATQTTTLGTLILNPYASATVSSGTLFGTGPGGGVVITTPSSFSLSVTHGVADRTDTISNPCGVASATVASVSQGATVFTSPADYSATVSATTIQIDWSADGNEPASGSTYTVVVDCPEIPLSAVVKTVSPVASMNARTSAQQEIVSGYSALGGDDVDPSGAQYVFPIVQTNNGWDSVLHITNFGNGLCPVTVTLYESPSGYSDPSFGTFTETLAPGQTWHIDLLAEGVPAEWVGQAWVSASACPVAATVDRIKATQPWGDPVNMALTNQAMRVDDGNTTQALPLIFQSYNGWNTGISIANLSTTTAANVTITYYNNAGVAVGTDSLTIQPRAMEFVYRPATTDVNIGGFGQALVTSSQPVHVAVDSVKYTGTGQDIGQALGYLAQGGATLQQFLSLALFQKQGGLGPSNDNSGVALFNTGNTSADVQLALRDASGALVAPTLTAPVATTIPAHGGFIFYAPDYAEMPGGFQGSVLVYVASESQVVGVSNNVNYDVQYDGSAAYNMQVTGLFDILTAQLTCTVGQSPAAGDDTADCTVTATVGPTPFNWPLVFEVDDSGDDDFSFSASSDVNTQATTTDASGTASAQLYWRTNTTSGSGFSVTVNVYYDVNGNGQLDSDTDVLLATTTCSYTPST